jgi:hypothetical protein
MMTLNRQSFQEKSMKNFTLVSALAAIFALSNLASSAQQAPAAPKNVAPSFPAGWTGKELNNMPPMIQETEDFINQNCQPATLDHIQIMNMQHGHGQAINIHVYCRQDKSPTAHYKLSLVPVVSRKLGDALYPLLDRANSRIVGFYFGKEGEDDDIMLLEKTK